MLDRVKLFHEFMRVKDRLFSHNTYTLQLLYELWEKIASDSTFAEMLLSRCASNLLPAWEGKVSDHYSLSQKISEYTVVGCDGSQIYPDRHGPIANCFVLNIGTVIMTYQAPASKAVLQSTPQLFLFDDIESIFNGIAISKDIIDCKREEHELHQLLVATKTVEQKAPLLSLVDGTILFWHLEGQNQTVRSFFFDEYCKTLEQFYQNNFLIAGYISAPRSRELIGLVQYAYTLSDEFDDGSQGALFNHSTDSMLMRHFLPVGSRSTLFLTNSVIAHEYPTLIRPYFFYINCGNEIARVELPLWIAQNKALVDTVATIIYDQIVKGQGYPVVLAESHEQAVIKSFDRDFFYTLFYKSSVEHKKKVSFSQKSLKKRRMNI